MFMFMFIRLSKRDYLVRGVLIVSAVQGGRLLLQMTNISFLISFSGHTDKIR